MLTVNDIINASFNKSNFGGYKTEDVDDFIDAVKESYELLLKKNVEQKEANESLAEENKKLAQKIDVLAKKVEEYRNEEDEIKNALISAQKLSEAALREARHKAEIILKDAAMKADEKLALAENEVEGKKEELEKMRQVVSDFRKTLLDKYKEHLTLINNIPSRKKTQKEEEPVLGISQPEEPARQTSKWEGLRQETAKQEMHTPSLQEQMLGKTQKIDLNEVTGSRHVNEEAAPEFVSSIEIEEEDNTPTKSFQLRASSFEKEQEEHPTGRDLRYDVMNFSEDYRMAEGLGKHGEKLSD